MEIVIKSRCIGGTFKAVLRGTCFEEEDDEDVDPEEEGECDVVGPVVDTLEESGFQESEYEISRESKMKKTISQVSVVDIHLEVHSTHCFSCDRVMII